MPEKLIHLVFKTHLDIGFTDHAAKVRRQYHDRFIPQAIETGEHFFAEDSERPQFIWTTGAWLIWDHLNSQPPDRVARLERAIERGLIRWHALPFTTHTELMSPALFRAGLSYAQELDARFGKQTRAAKMTDVPGHTLGMVSLLAEAGVRFLHLGVNSASPVPEVPEVFRWRAPSGEEVVVMYQASYGETHFPEGFDEGLGFAHTNDNLGPQSVPQVAEVFRALRHQYPRAEIRAATLEDFGALLWERREALPVVDIEIGDSWIHGSASDPTKTARFLALQRLYDGFAQEELTSERRSFGRGLAMVAEHTCGVDIKSYLRDEMAWDRLAFEAARKDDYRFAYTEASWAEQRAFLDEAVAHLRGADTVVAAAALRDLEPEAAPADPATPSGRSLSLRGWVFAFDPATGNIVSITAPDGAKISGRGGSLLFYRYESYDAADLIAHLDSYLTERPEWAELDHGRPGLSTALTAQSKTFVPRLAGVAATDEQSTLCLDLPELAHATLGAPRRVEISLAAASDSSLEVAVVLRDKPANRMPEASFVMLTPEGAESWDYCKLGLWQRGDRIAKRGGGQLQAVSGVRTELPDGYFQVSPLDTPLVAPAATPFMPFSKAAPDLTKGLRFNLHNNKWGTNFPMWWEGDLKCRFVMRFGMRQSGA